MIIVKFAHAGSPPQACAVANKDALFSIIWALDKEEHTDWWYIQGAEPSDYGFSNNWNKFKVMA